MPKVTLTPEQEHTLRDLDSVILDLHAELDKAEKAGLNVADLREALKSADTLRKNMIQLYGASARVAY